MAKREKLQKFVIWYGGGYLRGSKTRVVRAKDFDDVHKKYSHLDLYQIEKISDKKKSKEMM